MAKRFLPLAGALALTLALMAGCQDSQLTSPPSSSASASTDPYAVYQVALDFGNANDLASIPALAEDPSLVPSVMGGGDDGGRGGKDTTHRGGGGRDTTHKGGDTLHRGGDDTTHRGGGDDSLHNGGRGRGGKDTVRHDGNDTNRRGDKDTARRGGDGPNGPKVDLGRIFQQLNLTDEQAVAIRGCVNDLNDCLRSTAERFRAARQDLRDSLQADIQAIKDAVSSGRITAAEGRRLIAEKIAQYRRMAADLEARYKRATNECWAEFDRCVRSHLTREQIARWERLFHLGDRRDTRHGRLKQMKGCSNPSTPSSICATFGTLLH